MLLFFGDEFSSNEDNTNDDGMIELVLDPSKNKTGDTWHICIEVVSIHRRIPSDNSFLAQFFLLYSWL